MQIEATRARLRAVGARLLNRMRVRAWGTWTGVASARRRMRLVATRALHAASVRAINCWSAAVAERRRLQAFMRRALHGGLHRAWGRWLASGDERRQKQSFGRRWQHRSLAAAWRTWHAFAAERLCMRGVLGTAQRALNRELSRSWLAWRELWTVRARLAIVATRLLMKSQLRALNAWVAALEVARHARGLLRRTLLRCMHGGLSRCLERWLEHLRERRRLQQVGGRLQHRGLALGWNAWRAAVEEHAAVCRSMQRAATRMFTPALSRAWSNWLAMLDKMRQLALIACRLFAREQLRAFNQWLVLAEARRRLRRAVGGGLVHSALGHAWRQWTDVRSTRRRLQRFMCRLTNQGVGRVWTTWCDWCVRRAAAISSVSRVGARLRSPAVGRAWSHWRSTWRSTYEQRLRLQAIAWRVLYRGLSLALNAWVEATAVSRRMASMMFRALHRSLIHTWLVWQAASQDRRRLRRVGQRLLSNGVARAWHTWRALTTARVLERRRMVRVLRAALVRALGHWADIHRQFSRLRRLGRRMLHRNLSRAWEKWGSTIAEAERRRQLARRSIQRIWNGVLSRTFGAWTYLARSSRAARLEVERMRRAVLARMARRTEVMVLREWRGYVAGVRAMLAADEAVADEEAADEAVADEEAADEAAADEPDDEAERRGARRRLADEVDLSNEVVRLGAQLALTRTELAKVKKSAAWKYELAIVRDELRRAIIALARAGSPHLAATIAVASQGGDGRRARGSPALADGTEGGGGGGGGGGAGATGVSASDAELDDALPRVISEITGEIFGEGSSAFSTPTGTAQPRHRQLTYPLRPSSAAGWHPRDAVREAHERRDERHVSPPLTAYHTVPAGVGSGLRQFATPSPVVLGPLPSDAWAVERRDERHVSMAERRDERLPSDTWAVEGVSVSMAERRDERHVSKAERDPTRPFERVHGDPTRPVPVGPASPPLSGPSASVGAPRGPSPRQRALHEMAMQLGQRLDRESETLLGAWESA